MTDTEKHTPGLREIEITGPSQIEMGRWSISERESSTGITVNDCRGKSVARVPLRPDDLDIAHLIARAPALLAQNKRMREALEKIVNASMGHPAVVLQAVARAVLNEKE